MLNDIASNTSFFGIFITGVAYVLACAIQKRFKSSILNPLLVSCVILIIFMLVSGIDYNVYLYGKPKADGTYDGTGAIFFQNMLTPTTVCLAIRCMKSSCTSKSTRSPSSAAFWPACSRASAACSF